MVCGAKQVTAFSHAMKVGGDISGNSEISFDTIADHNQFAIRKPVPGRIIDPDIVSVFPKFLQ